MNPRLFKAESCVQILSVSILILAGSEALLILFVSVLNKPNCTFLAVKNPRHKKGFQKFFLVYFYSLFTTGNKPFIAQSINITGIIKKTKGKINN